MKTTEKAREVLQEIVALFEKGDLPEAISRTTIPMPDIPAGRWSLGNRLLMWAADTMDARTFLQWKDAGRFPKRGSKAVYILQPIRIKAHTREEDEDAEPITRLVGFKTKPVFRAQDTEGRPLGYHLEPPAPPPLIEVAKAWGIEVRYLPPDRPGVLGYHRASGKEIEIGLHTHDVQVFAHELAHAAHARVCESLQGGQRWDQEIVAELTAATLCRMMQADSDEGGAYRYIRHYAEEAGLNTERACMAVLKDVEACIDLILKTAAAEKKVAA